MSGAALRRLLALASGAAACAVALVWLPSTHVDGQYVPVGMDSFYHARRILDALGHPFAVAQFDPNMHAPEGSWITWPWAYDALMALVAGIAQRLFGLEPMAVLAHIPPLWAFVNAALLLACGATLGLRAPALALLGTAYALSPLTQMLHGAGVLDHHFVEYSFVLLALWLGLRWLQAPADRRRAAALGVALGTAPAFHNGLFALQLPLDLVLALLWLRRESPPLPATRTFALALAGATLAVVLPSQPFRDGRFEFQLLSGFHLYVAALSALGAVALSWRPFTPQRLAAYVPLAAAMLLPVAADALGGSRFLSATLVKLADMQEAASLADLYARGGWHELARGYGGLLFLMPLTAVAALVLLVRRTAPAPLRYAAAFALFGGALLCFQWRLHYWGSPALFLGPLLLLQGLADRIAPERRFAAQGAGAALLLAALILGAAGLWRPVPVGWSFDYMYVRAAFPAIAEACAAHPGVILADNNDGHPLRFHTDCAVISNNFILTPQHEEKLLLGERLLGLDARTLIDRYPWVDYVFVRRNDAIFEDLPAAEVAAQNAGLRGELLLDDGPWPAELELLVQLRTEVAPGRPLTLARAFRIHHRSPGVKDPSPPKG